MFKIITGHNPRKFLLVATAAIAAFIFMPRPVAEPDVGYSITDRGVLPFGVPFVRSGKKYGNDRPTALDVGPRGDPDDQPNSGKAWIDVCNADLITDPKAPVSCLYSGIWSDHAEFGSRSFNGASAVPLKIRIGNKIVGELTEDGLVIYGSITAGKLVTRPELLTGKPELLTGK